MFYFGDNLGRGGFGYVDRVRSRLSLNEFAVSRDYMSERLGLTFPYS